MAELFDRTSLDVKEITVGNPPTRMAVFPPNFTTPVTYSTAGAIEDFTAADLLGGMLVRDPAGASRADKVPTAAVFLAGLSGNKDVGRSGLFCIVNTADAAETITVTTNTGVTLTGLMTIAQNQSGIFVWRVTSSTTITIYRVA